MVTRRSDEGLRQLKAGAKAGLYPNRSANPNRRSKRDPNVLSGSEAVSKYMGRRWETIVSWIEQYGFPMAKLPNGTWTTTRSLIDDWIRRRAAYQTACRIIDRGGDVSEDTIKVFPDLAQRIRHRDQQKEPGSHE